MINNNNTPTTITTTTMIMTLVAIATMYIKEGKKRQIDFKMTFFIYVYWTMHHLDSWIKRDQLDVTCFIISLFNAQHVLDVLTTETCWALNNEIIKQVTSSWSLFILLLKWLVDKSCTILHELIYMLLLHFMLCCLGIILNYTECHNLHLEVPNSNCAIWN